MVLEFIFEIQIGVSQLPNGRRRGSKTQSLLKDFSKSNGEEKGKVLGEARDMMLERQ
jgi:hypothetical protein